MSSKDVERFQPFTRLHSRLRFPPSSFPHHPSCRFLSPGFRRRSNSFLPREEPIPLWAMFPIRSVRSLPFLSLTFSWLVCQLTLEFERKADKIIPSFFLRLSFYSTGHSRDRPHHPSSKAPCVLLHRQTKPLLDHQQVRDRIVRDSNSAQAGPGVPFPEGHAGAAEEQLEVEG